MYNPRAALRSGLPSAEEWFSKSPRKRKYRAVEKEMNMKRRMDLRSFVRISGMSLVSAWFTNLRRCSRTRRRLKLPMFSRESQTEAGIIGPLNAITL